MTLLAAVILAAAGAAAGVGQTPVATPFVLPPSVTSVTGSADGKGWAANGELRLAFKSAQARLSTSLAASGWTHVHAIELGKGRVLDAWNRGDKQLTVMVWRISAGRSGFSYGFSGTGGKLDPAAVRTAFTTNAVGFQEAKDGRAL